MKLQQKFKFDVWFDNETKKYSFWFTLNGKEHLLFEAKSEDELVAKIQMIFGMDSLSSF